MFESRVVCALGEKTQPTHCDMAQTIAKRSDLSLLHNLIRMRTPARSGKLRTGINEIFTHGLLPRNLLHILSSEEPELQQ